LLKVDKPVPFLLFTVNSPPHISGSAGLMEKIAENAKILVVQEEVVV